METKTLDEAMAILFKQKMSLTTEILPLLEAQNKILAQDIFATKSLPSFDNSAMDGYALNTKDKDSSLEICANIFAGDCKDYAIAKGQCAKIMTGAKIPEGADCVVPFEEIEGGFQNTKTIKAPSVLKEDANIKKCGEEVRCGDLLLKKGSILNADCLTLLASQGISHIVVFRALKIAVFASGNELKEPWEEANAYQIYNSNAIMVQAVLKSYAFCSVYGGILRDNLEDAIQALQSPYDVIFTTGGASKGEADYMREALAKIGATILFASVKIKPGKPIMVARVQQKILIALPGNPIAGGVTLRAMIIPFLHTLSGANAYHPQFITLKAKTTLQRKPRTEILLAKIQGNYVSFTKKGKYGSSEITPMAQSNALVFLDKESVINAEDSLKVLPFKMEFSE